MEDFNIERSMKRARSGGTFKFFKTKSRSFICVATGKKLDDYIDDENKLTLKRNKLFPIFPAKKLAKFIDENAT